MPIDCQKSQGYIESGTLISVYERLGFSDMKRVGRCLQEKNWVNVPTFFATANLETKC